MKVLYITASLSQGGAATGSRNTIEAIKQSGCEVIEVDQTSASFPRLFKILRNVERVLEKVLIKSSHNDAHFIKLFPASINLNKMIKKHNPDIIHFGFIAGNIVSYREVSNVDIPIVWRLSDFWGVCGPFHYTMNKKTNIINNIVMFFFGLNFNPEFIRKTTVVCPSHWTKNYVAKNSLVKPYATVMIENAVSTQEIISKKNVITNHMRKIKLVIIAGNLNDKRKGVRNALKFFDELCKVMFCKVEITLVGQCQSTLISGLENISTSCLGVLNGDDVKKTIQDSDFLICPSTEDNSPNVVTESLSLSTPVIIQSNTGASTYVEDEVTGLSVDFCDVSLNNLLYYHSKMSKINLGEMRENCKYICDVKYSHLTIGKKYNKIYLGLIK